jgi:hypothetical protein
MSEVDSTEYRVLPWNSKYRVGSDGSVWRWWAGAKRYREKYQPKWKLLKPAVDQDGYHRVVIYNNGKRKRYFAHHLVLVVFVGPQPEGMICRHFPDRNPANNTVSNLSWGTQLENEADKDVHGTRHRMPGEKHPFAILTAERVIKIRQDYATGEFTQQELASREGVTRGAIGDVVRRINWKHI